MVSHLVAIFEMHACRMPFKFNSAASFDASLQKNASYCTYFAAVFGFF